jgi:hypothetical protein
MLASEVMTQTAALLNDTGLSLYTYAVQLPYLQKANEDLEKKLSIMGAPQQRKQAIITTLSAGNTTVDLPSDFLLPIRLFERNHGDSTNNWIPMAERDWEQENAVQTVYLGQWAFRDNKIYVIGSTVAKDILLEYWRNLAVIADSSSTEDFAAAKGYLASRSAELCARYIGMNDVLADKIAVREVGQAEDELMRILVLNQQGTPQRRGRFSTIRRYVSPR